MSTKVSKGRRLAFEAMEDRRVMAVAPVITSNGGGAAAQISVLENVSRVTQVTATDADGGTPRYSIVGGEDAAAFSVGMFTGALVFKTTPNFERPIDIDKNNEYKVTVAARDASGLQDTQAITIKVVNVNERPYFTNNGGKPNATISLAENTKAVTTVKAIDPENPNTLGIRYSIAGGPDANYFALTALTGVLVFKQAPDFESTTHGPVYKLIVQATDSSGVKNFQTITINVTDLPNA